MTNDSHWLWWAIADCGAIVTARIAELMINEWMKTEKLATKICISEMAIKVIEAICTCLFNCGKIQQRASVIVHLGVFGTRWLWGLGSKHGSSRSNQRWPGWLLLLTRLSWCLLRLFELADSSHQLDLLSLLYAGGLFAAGLKQIQCLAILLCDRKQEMRR